MGTHPIFESDFDCLTVMGGHKVWHSTVDDGGNQYRWFLKEYKPPTKWPDSIDTTKNINGAKDWFPYGVPWGEDIWQIWGKEGLVKRPVKVTRAQRAAARLTTFNNESPDHCQEFYMNVNKCVRDKRAYYGHLGAQFWGKHTGDCSALGQAVSDCVVQEKIIGMALQERVKRVQLEMNIDYMPKGWF